MNEETKRRALQIGTLMLLLLLLLLFMMFLRGNKGVFNPSASYEGGRGSSSVADPGEGTGSALSAAGMGHRTDRAERPPEVDDRPWPDGLNVQIGEVDSNGIKFTVTSGLDGTPQDFSTSDPGPVNPFDDGNPIIIAFGGGGTLPPSPGQGNDGGGAPGDGDTTGVGDPGDSGNPGGTPWPGNTLLPPQIINAGVDPPAGTGGGISPDQDSTATPVPEPGTMMLLGSGLIGLAGWGRKKFRK